MLSIVRELTSASALLLALLVGAAFPLAAQREITACHDLRQARSELREIEQTLRELYDESAARRRTLEASESGSDRARELAAEMAETDRKIYDLNRARRTAMIAFQDQRVLFSDAVAPINEILVWSKRQVRTAETIAPSDPDRCSEIVSENVANIRRAMDRYGAVAPCMPEMGLDHLLPDLQETSEELLSIGCLPPELAAPATGGPGQTRPSGPRSRVPPVRGLLVTDAERVISEAGLQPESFEVRAAPTPDQEGLVAWQSPAAGETVERGAVIDVAFYGAFEGGSSAP